MWRRDRIPTLTVQADVAPGVLPETVVDAIDPAVEQLAKTLPPGYRIDVGGTVEESAKSQASVVAMVPVMLLAMLTVLMFELRSFQRLFIVLTVAPLGLIGVVLALLVSGRPLGFVAILGILALIGMITKNAVILIGQIEAERAAGKDVWKAAVDASSARFRPILLTAVSTVLGLIPIAPTVFWGPMAFAIMGGLLVATILTLVFLPTLYVTWFRGRAPKEALGRGRSGEERQGSQAIAPVPMVRCPLAPARSYGSKAGFDPKRPMRTGLERVVNRRKLVYALRGDRAGVVIPEKSLRMRRLDALLSLPVSRESAVKLGKLPSRIAKKPESDVASVGCRQDPPHLITEARIWIRSFLVFKLSAQNIMNPYKNKVLLPLALKPGLLSTFFTKPSNRVNMV